MLASEVPNCYSWVVKLHRVFAVSAPLLLVSACADSPESAGGSESVQVVFEVVDVQPAEAEIVLNDGNGSVVVLDVRTPQEFAAGHIRNALNVNIAGPVFDQKVAALDHTKSYLVHCASGSPGGRSQRALASLKAAGAKRVYHLQGGFNAWLQAGNPVEVPGAQ